MTKSKKEASEELDTLNDGSNVERENMIRSFDTQREAINWEAKAPWPYSTLGLSVRGFEVETHLPQLLEEVERDM